MIKMSWQKLKKHKHNFPGKFESDFKIRSPFDQRKKKIIQNILVQLLDILSDLNCLGDV